MRDSLLVYVYTSFAIFYIYRYLHEFLFFDLIFFTFMQSGFNAFLQ